MAYNRSFLTKIRTIPYPFLVSLPNGYKVRVTEIGDDCLSLTIILHKVLFIPSFKFNLIFIHCLTSNHKTVISFNSSFCLMHDPSLKIPLGIGRARNSLYFFCPKCHSNSHSCFTPTYSSGVFSTFLVSSPHTSSLSSFICSNKPYVCNNSVHSSLNKQTNVSQPISHVNFPSSRNEEVCIMNDNSPLQSIKSLCFVETHDSHSSHGHNVDHLWHTRLGHVPFEKNEDSILNTYFLFPKTTLYLHCLPNGQASKIALC